MASRKKTTVRKRCSKPARRRRRAKKRPAPRLASRGAKRLLEVRLCDLPLSIERSVLAKRIKQVYRELERRDLRFRPYFWLSDDWFTPEGVTGTAIPFYLAHPRLTRLERSQMGEVEGGTRAWCMKILRHEVGHAIDHAFLLHRRRRWQQLFGISSRPYPRYYQPNPYSRRHVLHLEYWYAQSHPDEDFAETFAVWLGSTRAHWRKRYRGWPALKKLEYVDELMAEIALTRPLVRTRTRMDGLSRLYKTLGEHYAAKRRSYGEPHPADYDADLARLFSAESRHRRRDHERAAAFIRRVRVETVRTVARWTGGAYRYHLGHVLKDMIGRCGELKLYVRPGARNLKRDLAILLTKHMMDSLYRNRRWIRL